MQAMKAVFEECSLPLWGLPAAQSVQPPCAAAPSLLAKQQEAHVEKQPCSGEGDLT